ncbi:uncharacterized protein LOC111319268 [Stylophora pistillata]|uniref:E3 ubiquitin-protein ligase DZIP3 n=1 Tax=Stylophora pistillata TaxID=50429 RepID=A0A2B4SWJ7_STYPI|nr:uncharacterized protein LOC111319268 [Stylophora pistillata]PFX32795.1 E3 ubiquitin-protein ligase DZIP3 [Stylophora pistillata]
MASVTPTASSTKETTNYARLCRLLVDIGTQALRDTLDAIHAPANLPTVLAANQPTLQSLRAKGIINPIQWGKLFPAIPTSVSSSNFDTTLLMVLLRNLCGLTAPLTGWNAFPAATDLSREADIARVKYFRNTVYGHAEIASVDDNKFNYYWRDIRDTLVRLGGVNYEAAIDYLRNETMDPVVEDHYVELLRQWKKDEDNIKDELAEIKKKLEEITSKDIIDEERIPDGKQSSPKQNSGESLFEAIRKRFTEHGDLQSGQPHASPSVPDRTPGGNQSSPGESLFGPLLQSFTGHGDPQSGQLTLKGREIHYRSHRKIHSSENLLVYDATAWDLESGFTYDTSGYDNRNDAVDDAVDKLMGILKSEGLLS